MAARNTIDESLSIDLRRVGFGTKARQTNRQSESHQARIVSIKKMPFLMSISFLLKAVKGGEVFFIDCLKQIVDTEHDPSEGRLARFLKSWDDQPKGKKFRASIDNLIVQSGMRTAEVYGWYSSVAFDVSGNILKQHASVAAPLLMKASLSRALDVERGGREREMHFKAMGYLPTSKGVAVQVNNIPAGGASGDGDGTRPSFVDDDARDVVGVLRSNSRHALPARVDIVDAEPVQHEPANVPSRDDSESF